MNQGKGKNIFHVWQVFRKKNDLKGRKEYLTFPFHTMFWVPEIIAQFVPRDTL